MLIGHLAVAFAAKKTAPKVSLGTFFLATLFLDVICLLLLILGIERVQYDPGNTAVTPIDFVSYPFSHSLLASLLWAGLFSLIYFKIKRCRQTALLTGAVVFSHWVLDFFSHGPDLTLYPGSPVRLGLGLWNSIPATLTLEGSFFAAAVLLYAKMTRPKNALGKFGLWGLTAALATSYFAVVFYLGEPAAKLLIFSEAAALGTILFAYRLDNERTV